MKQSEEPVKYLKNQVAKIAAAAEFITSRTSDWQVIRQYLTNRSNDLKLSAQQKDKLDRFQFMYNQLVTGKFTDSEVITATMKLYHVEQRQAYDDLNSTRELFSSILNVNKRFELSIQLQINRSMLRKAEEACDFKAYASLEKNRALLLSNIEDLPEELSDIFEGHAIEAVFDPKLIGAEDVDMAAVLRVINSKRKAKIKTDLFTDIPHEELNGEEATTL